jgi:hypothetical protein
MGYNGHKPMVLQHHPLESAASADTLVILSVVALSHIADDYHFVHA